MTENSSRPSFLAVFAAVLMVGAFACSSSDSSGNSASDGGASDANANGGSGDSGGGGGSDATTVASMAIGPAGGTLTVTSDGPLKGTSIVVPAGALSTNVTIAIHTSAANVTTGTERAAGPVVDFEPSGTTFSQAATMQIPFTLPSGATVNDLSVAVVETGGSRQEIKAQSFTNGLATFPASGFTIFGAIAAQVSGVGGNCSAPGDCTGVQQCVNGQCR